MWKSTSELGYLVSLHAIEPTRGHGDNVASMAWNRHAIQLRWGARNFDFHTGNRLALRSGRFAASFQPAKHCFGDKRLGVVPGSCQDLFLVQDPGAAGGTDDKAARWWVALAL